MVEHHNELSADFANVNTAVLTLFALPSLQRSPQIVHRIFYNAVQRNTINIFPYYEYAFFIFNNIYYTRY